MSASVQSMDVCIFTQGPVHSMCNVLHVLCRVVLLHNAVKSIQVSVSDAT